MKNRKVHYYLRNTLLFLAIVLADMPVIGQIDSISAFKLTTIQFGKNKTGLSENSKRKLDSALLIMKRFDSCNIQIRSPRVECRKCAVKEWDRTEAVSAYLIKKGWNEQRIVLMMHPASEDNTVEVEKGERLDTRNTAPAPHPTIKKHIN